MHHISVGEEKHWYACFDGVLLIPRSCTADRERTAQHSQAVRPVRLSVFLVLGRLHRGDDAGALLDFDRAVDLSAGARGEYFVQRARARARVAMRSNGREEAIAGLKVSHSNTIP